MTEKVGKNTWYRGKLKGKTVWVHESYLDSVEGSSTSHLGHIRSSKAKIYDDLTLTSSFQAGSTYTHQVYYIKKQASLGDQLYYLISTQPSSTKGTVGWVKSSDLSTHPHTRVDKDSKVFYVKGTGKAYSKAWGGSKDLVYNLSKLKGEVFQVHMTEKVGKNTWYRGKLKGKTVWVHESYLDSVEGSSTSHLGHIRSSKAKIYDDLTLTSSFQAGSTYTHQVYYIKKQASLGDQLYYLISMQPSSTKGTVGWVKSSDLSTHPHTRVDKDSKVFYVKGTGKAYSKAWGGSKDLVYNLSELKGEVFQVHMTEKVGKNTWYRGKLKGKTVWVHESYLDSVEGSSTSHLGHIRSSKAKIYDDLTLTSSFQAGSTYTHQVYYIKKQASLGDQLYYLISTQPSSTKGTVGWVKSSDLSTHPHTRVDKDSKVFYVKGTGKAYSKAWGGSKHLVYNLSKLKGEVFQVHMTEKVGKNTWYRGKLKGKTVWVHESYLDSVEGSSTSHLGHIRSSKAKIYDDLTLTSSFQAGSTYTHQVYYIKKQASLGDQLYYLISMQPSSTKGTVGWVKSSDLSTHPHT